MFQPDFQMYFIWYAIVSTMSLIYSVRKEAIKGLPLVEGRIYHARDSIVTTSHLAKLLRHHRDCSCIADGIDVCGGYLEHWNSESRVE